MAQRSLSELAIHPRPASILQRVSQSPPQSLLLAGPAGVGLRTIANALAREAKGQVLAQLEPRESRTQNVNRSSGVISVKDIRALYEQTRGRRVQRGFVVIADADRMSPGASAAFLKLLEEPSSNVTFVLTSHRPEQLLDTILSRVQRIEVPIVPDREMESFEASLAVEDEQTRRQLHYIAQGRPALMKRLLENETEFATLKEAMSHAQQILKGDAYQRYLVAYRTSKTMGEALAVIQALIVVIQSLIRQQPDPRFIAWLERLSEAEARIYRGFSPRLQMLACVI